MLDVHKDSISIAVAPEGRDGAQLIGKFPNNITTLQRHFAKLREGSTRSGKPLISDLGSGPVELEIAYEAGPCGFVLYRHLTQLGYDCQVVAPSLIPQSAGDRVKTDKRDAKKLAIHHRAGNLIAVCLHLNSRPLFPLIFLQLCPGRTLGGSRTTNVEQLD